MIILYKYTSSKQFYTVNAVSEMWLVYLMAASVLASDCEAIKFYNRPSHLSNRPIIGGVDAQITNFPYQVSLVQVFKYEGKRYPLHACGGSIIGVDWVLTAAHCVQRLYPDDIWVHVGSSAVNEGGFLRAVTKIIPHAQYGKDLDYDYDIALLKVAKPFEIGPNVKPIPLNKNPLQPGELAVISGWGFTSEGGDTAMTLQKVEVTIVPQWECRWLYGHDSLSDNMFCADGAGKGSCQGDSGGPVVANGVLVGIVSWGYGCVRPGFPGVYASIEKLRKWIIHHSGV